MVLEENTLQSHQVHAVWRLLLRLTLSTDVCNIDMGTQIRMGKIIFNKEWNELFPCSPLPCFGRFWRIEFSLSIFRWLLGGLSTSAHEWSGDIELDGNGGFYKIYSSSGDKSVWLRGHHFNMSSEKRDFLPDWWISLPCHSGAQRWTGQPGVIKGCWAAGLHPAGAAGSSVFPEWVSSLPWVLPQIQTVHAHGSEGW